ncbi:MAG: beta-propeller fold lactonase family protein [Spirochaetaceae bacterium]
MQFSIDTASGRLSAGRNVSLAGKTPRDFTFSSDGRRLIALCQDSKEAFSYSVDPETGVMEEVPTDRVEMGTPVCIIGATPGRAESGRTASGRTASKR